MQSSTSNKVVLGKYRVLKKIGAGGMGDVYEAVDVEQDMPVALKTVVVEKLSDANRVRLEREAEALSRFDHPNIVGFHGMIAQGKMIFCIMELIRGEALSKLNERLWRLEKSKVPIEKAISVAKGIASAIEHAHAQKVLHRDIKPDNILLEEGGRVVLTDFGLAKVKDLFSVTQAGQALGTVIYFAPEQMKGEQADERTDIYQLGLTLYETTTGILPFGEEPPLAAMKKRIRKPIPAPRELNSDVPEYLSTAIQKCLQPKPENRFQTMEELSEALESQQIVKLPLFASASRTDHKVIKREKGDKSSSLPRKDKGRSTSRMRVIKDPPPVESDEKGLKISPTVGVAIVALFLALVAAVIIFAL